MAGASARRVRCAALLLAAAAWCAAGPGPPRLQFPHDSYNLTIPENSAPRTYADPPPGALQPALPLPAEGARMRFRIRHGDRDKFFKAEERVVGDKCFLLLRTRAGHADVLNRERRDAYRLDVHASAQLPDGVLLETDVVLFVEVTDENDLSPLFYPTQYEALVPEDAPLHSSIVRVTAEDADVGINGEIYYSLAETTDQFAVHPTSGVVTLTRALVAAESARHEVTLLARDRASLLARGGDAPAARATLVVRVARVNLHAPELRARRLPELIENSTAEVYAIVEVTDRDSGEHGRIASLEIVDGDPDGHFRVRPSAQPGEYDVVAHALLDRETAPRGYNLTLRATDAGRPARSSYLTLPVTLVDANDNAPVFSREVYEASVPETAPPNTPVIRLKVSDRDAGSNARVYIEIVGGNEGGEFSVNPDTGVLYTAVPLDAEDKSLYTLTVSAIDQGNAGTRKQSSAKVKIAIVDANDNDPVFDKDDVEVALAENGPTGVMVARVSARDADSGENAYISYSVANLQPIPFEVDHFSGAVRTTKLLDYESMRREYVLRIRASDWGLPYRRQAEMRLTVRLQDVNDNRPQFERVDCVGYLPRRLPVGHDIVTLSAIDFDSGDVVSYRFIGGNDDNCFSLDPGTGVVSLSCDLADVRADTRVLNVTATDGTHFADPASLTLHLVSGGGGDGSALECRDTGVARRLVEMLAAAERSNAPVDVAEDFPPAPSRYGENLHIPEFVDFPVEVKVNESVALGTSLVRLHARDRDLGYNGLLVYSVSGGDADSAFRIDPDTGDLKVIGYLDRERESEYYLNVTVFDLGVPQRSSSRLLPVTVLDVNDNPPRFQKTLASFRVTENAINGTEIFRANATDRDTGLFARVHYSLSGADDGEFCVERDTGALFVCAPLDRERRALYELTVRATDGGGLRAEALVRVAVDDVNDNAPRFALPSYSARVREDVPLGTPVAVLEAFDPDLGAGGVVTYSLPDQPPDDVVFTIDSTSGTVRTAKLLDYEEKQVYGVTVRATDGARPARWGETTLLVELGDVDENRHAPVFAERGALALRVREGAAAGARVGTLRASDADTGRDARLAYYVLDGGGMPHFSVDDSGLVRTLTPLDRERATHYWLTVCAEDHGLVPRHACIQVYVEVEDVNDVAPWPERAAYNARIPEHCPAGTRVAAVRAPDGDAAPEPVRVRYSIVAGNPDGLFAIDEDTGEIVTTGRALDREAASSHALEVRAWDGELAAAVRVRVQLDDINDHAPAFTQRFYDVRVPVPRHQDEDETTEAAESSAEGDAEAEAESDSEADEEDERLVWDEWDEPEAGGVYVATVLALDPDAAENGTVRYAGRARGAARGLLRVHSRTGRLYAARALPLRRRAYDLAVRACDGGVRARCSVSRARVRGAPPGGGRPPRLSPPAPLQAAELDAPGFLLALLQATDPDGDALYYDIVGGDPERDFVVGREDGSLVVARRLLWERRPHYALNVSVTDGLHTVYTTVNVTVINDANEGGVQFERENYTVEVSEAARVGDTLLALRAAVVGAEGAANTAGQRLLYGVHATRAPADAALFRLHELTGVLELARPLDRESSAEHELTVWARDQAPRASRAFARVRVLVHDADEHAPTWPRRLVTARVPRGAAPGALVARLRAAERDSGPSPRYSLAGDARAQFAIDDNGDVRLARALPTAAAAPRDYALLVRAAGPPPAERTATLPLHIIVVEPDDTPPRFTSEDTVFEVYENEPAGTVLGTLEARSGTAVWYALHGGEGLFRLNPAAGVLALAAPLDYEARALHNLTVTALNMGGGAASTRVFVHVLDRNEFAPRLRERAYRGRVSEAAARGALVAAAGGAPLGEPLVLAADDADSPANRQRAYEILEPDAAALFRIDATTGALALAAQLDYERAALHVFTVKVVDMGTPRLPSDSTATVSVEVTNVNDCPPQFSQEAYEATVLLPTVAGVRVLSLVASDADEPHGAQLTFDVLDGDPEGAFALSASGELVVAVAELLRAEHRLRVRVSDGRYASTARVTVRAREPDPAGLAFHKTDYYASVLENTTRPTTVAVLNVLGAALNEHVEFSILNPTDGFEIGVTSGAVRSGGVALDRERCAAYTLLVRAAAGARRAHARLHVAVSDLNDNCPVFTQLPYAAALPAGEPPGTSVLRVHATDADANDNGEVRYEMKRGNGELFRVDRRSGLVSLKQTLEAHNQLYTLVVAAFDGGTPACGAEAEVSVRVWGGGGAPRWARAHYALTVREGPAPRALQPALRAHSPLGRALIYTLQHGPAHLFEVHFDTAPEGGNAPCAVVARGALDYEAAREHRLVVRATDGVSGTFADVAVSVHVLDVNDCAPEFAHDEYRAAVSEAAEPGDLVLRVRAADNDTDVVEAPRRIVQMQRQVLEDIAAMIEGSELEDVAVEDLVELIATHDDPLSANGNVTYALSWWGAAGEAAGEVLPFSVEAASGAVRVAGALDRETRAEYHLLVTASDGGRPALLTTAHIFITVDDVNDNAPRMERAVLTALVSEEASRGTVLARVAAWDPDARDAARLRYALAGDAAERRAFALDAASGLLALAEPRALVAVPALARRSLNVSVSDGAHASFARVKLALAPANRAAPRFPHRVHEARALENQPPPLLLTTVKAYDEDAGEYGALTYSIPSARLRDTFAVDARSGALTARVPLDRERRAEWEVPVMAADGGGRLAHTTVRVRVADLNDCAPVFPLREYRAAPRADRAPALPFLTLHAHDADAPADARLTYSLYDGDLRSDASGLFALDALTGALSFARNASAFGGRTLQLWVRARDAGGLVGEAPVSVHVLGPGPAPRLKRPPPELFLREDAPPGTLVAELAEPGAPGEPAPRYRLADAPSRDLFAVDAAGRLVLAAPLDRETAADHYIGVIAEGAGSPAPAVMVSTRLRVLDVNEHAPTFHSQPYVVHLAENTPPNSYVVQLMADDLDSGSNGEVRFSLGAAEGMEDSTEEGAAEELPFAVEAESGWVRTTRALDREARAEYRVPLLASDAGAPPRSSRGTLVVRLLDYDDCPPAFQQDIYEAEVREDAAAGTVAVRLRVADADAPGSGTAGGAAGSPRAYFVADGDEGARFQLRAAAGGAELYVARALDRERTPAYDLRVATTDGKFTAYTRVRLTVLDVNDNPPYCVQHRMRARVPEAAARGARVAALRVHDADEPHNARARFYLTGDNAQHFAIDKETGVITVAEDLDRETVAEYKLVAHAQDRDRPEWECSTELEVALDDVNDNAPRFSTDTYSVTLPEDADVGTLVAKVHATDADLGENSLVHYSFVEDDEHEGGDAFELTSDSGIIRLRAALDRESRAEHRVRVRAVDAGSPPRSATATVRLTVADVNDNPPEFELKQYRASAPELHAVGTELLRVRATSRDTGVNADVYYSLVAGDDRDDFALDRSSGALTIARPLDFERRKEYFLTVQAVDGGTPPLSDHATVNITVLDGNDNAPVFSQTSYGAQVREDAAPGAPVLQVVADDADAGANGRVTYSIVRGDRDARFAVDADTGHVSLAAPLDREATPAYVLELRARDRGQPSLESTAFLNVEVLDANDNPPLFAQTNYTAVVQEDKPLGHTILKFEVEDADTAPNAAPFTFDFQSGNEMGAFRLEQDGYLRSATRFNHRIKDRYILQVRVFDNGTPPLFSDAWVYIKVIEESHHPPVVTPLEIVVNSYLDEFPGGVIGRVFASDRDAYDTLSYALAPVDGAPYPSTDLFEIDAALGTLRAAPRIDVGEYRLNVTVDDGKFLGFAVVHVTVVLVSDEMLAQAIVIRFREVTDHDFVLSHRKGFVRAVQEATKCKPSDVVIVGVQPSDAPFEPESPRPLRSVRQVAQDLDVAFAVRSGDGSGFLSAEALRRGLHAHLVRLEKSAGLVVEEMVRATCGGCVHGACAERVQLQGQGARAVASDVFALVVAPHRLRAACVCAPGYDGERCERAVAACAECGAARCESVPAPPGYRCCDDDVPDECRPPPLVTFFPGDGYLVYRLDRGVVDGERLLEDELTLSLRFRTRRSRGILLHAAGRVEYVVLEVVEGFVQFRMELGAGAVALRAGGEVADGEWHRVRVERRGAAVRLSVDRRSARAQAPPRDQVLDARRDRVLVGAALLRHAYALAPEQVTYGFHGCIADLKIGNSALPLEEGGTSEDGRVQLTRRVRARPGAACPALPSPAACDAYPCLNGGTCRPLAAPAERDAELDAGTEAFACTCHARFAGRLCELDTDPCAAQPCLHGGYCSRERGAFRCACAAGLTGVRCERGRWCAAGVCAHGGACEDGERGPSCRCRGYYGPRCEYDIDECAGEPCLNGATCLNEPGSFRCLCPPDKTGMNCGNPLYSDAVVAGEAGGARALRDAWRWAVRARWPLAAGPLVALALLAACAAPAALRRRAARARARRDCDAPLNSALDKVPPPRCKLSNLDAVRRERPASCADPPPLNNIDTLRSYGSAGDELEGIPPDYLRNLNIDAPDRKPWSEQMHLHTFVDNKIYNDLKGSKRSSGGGATGRNTSGVRAAPAAVSGSPHLVGGYHWDCSDWCGGGGLPGISEVAGSERPDSSDAPSPAERATPSPSPPPRTPRAHRSPRRARARPAALTDTDSAADDLDRDADTLRYTDASSYLLHPDEYLPAPECTPLRMRRDPDAASLITMLAEERHSLLGGAGSCSDLSAHLCEIEDSEAEEPGGVARHTDV
ncbi:fat-like cadherin-related tumor suppressor homolog [Battus philenor]|uniref:fat-like cadherin-related tumor suppressor homolog n=1 Tax=Battus philenor TaxID=42288 RepID=UPI0035CE8704